MSNLLLVTNSTVVTLGSDDVKILKNHAIYAKDGVIVEVGASEDLVKKYGSQVGLKIVDAGGKWALPGMICAHGHFYGMYARGMDMKCESPFDFITVLERLWWRLDRALQHDSTFFSALVFYVAAIKAGTTCILDHHASPSAITGSLDKIAEAAVKSGVRSSLCYEVTDRNGKDGAMEGIKENARFIRKCATEKNPLLAASFGLHASFTVGEETAAECVKSLNEIKKEFPSLPVGFHVHLAEGLYDVEHAKKTWGCTVTERMEKAGLLGPHTIVGHGVHINEAEMDILKRTGTSLVTNPESNMNNALGIPKILKMLEKGILVGLGTDGMTYDMFQEYKANYLIHKHANQDPRVMGGEGFSMLTKNNSLLASKFFQKPVGKLEPGCFADIILLDYKPPTPVCAGSLPWHVMFGMDSSLVDTTIVAGKVLMSGRKLTFLDEDEIASGANALAEKVWGSLPPVPVK